MIQVGTEPAPTLDMPRADPARPPIRDDVAMPIPERPVRVLYAEDDADIHLAVRTALPVSRGFDLAICENGAEALERVDQFQPDIIVLDVMMPVVDGPTTFLRLKSRPGLAEVPVIFLTACVRPEECEAYFALGARAVIPKPFDPAKLPELLSAHIGPGMPESAERDHDGETLSRRYLERTAHKVADIETAIDRMSIMPHDHENLQALRLIVHRLKGSGGTFGFPAISRLGARSEDAIDLLIERLDGDTSERGGRADADEIEICLEGIRGYVDELVRYIVRERAMRG